MLSSEGELSVYEQVLLENNVVVKIRALRYEPAIVIFCCLTLNKI